LSLCALAERRPSNPWWSSGPTFHWRVVERAAAQLSKVRGRRCTPARLLEILIERYADDPAAVLGWKRVLRELKARRRSGMGQ
jgi:hypothetical protein